MDFFVEAFFFFCEVFIREAFFSEPFSSEVSFAFSGCVRVGRVGELVREAGAERDEEGGQRSLMMVKVWVKLVLVVVYSVD